MPNYERYVGGRADGYQISLIQNNHREMMRLSLIGMPAHIIAKRLGVKPRTVNRVLQSDIVKAQMEHLQVARTIDAIDVSKALVEEAPRCLELLVEARDDDNLPLKERIKVAQDLLDRGGYGRVQRGKIAVEHGGTIRGLIDKVKERKNAERVVEAEVVKDETGLALPEES